MRRRQAAAFRFGSNVSATGPRSFRCRRSRSSAPRAKTFAEALEVTAEVYHSAGAIMAERGLLQGVAHEGGWWPAFSSNEEALETLMRAIERAGLVPGEDVAISLDVAASEFGKGGRYRLGLDKRDLDRDA